MEQGQQRNLTQAGCRDPVTQHVLGSGVERATGTACQPVLCPTKEGPCWAPQKCPAPAPAAHLLRS